MFGFLRRLNKSLSFMDALADEMGVDRKVFSAALTEAGVNFAEIERRFRALDDTPLDERTMQFAAIMVEPALHGCALLEAKFGPQEKLSRLETGLERYLEIAQARFNTD